MPKSFLVKKKTEKYKKIPISLIVSSPGNGYVREFNQISAEKSASTDYGQEALLSNDRTRACYTATVSERKTFQPQNNIAITTLRSISQSRRETTSVVKGVLVTNTSELINASGDLISAADGLPVPTKHLCHNCNKVFTTLTTLLRHQEFHCNPHQKRPFHCKYCDKLYLSLGALKMHIRTHTLPCKCKICGKAFSRPWLLQGHVRTHTGEKPYKCTHCQRAFADRSNLRAHLQTHSDVKKYCCARCCKSFSRMSLLLKHRESCTEALQVPISH